MVVAFIRGFRVVGVNVILLKDTVVVFVLLLVNPMMPSANRVENTATTTIAINTLTVLHAIEN